MFYFYFIMKNFSQWKRIHIQILSNVQWLIDGNLYRCWYKTKKSNLTFFIKEKNSKTVKLFFWEYTNTYNKNKYKWT